ncbi:hypothetical protein B0H66DRAFT_542679 [Apodospora peruviana]|uniref:Thioredoxin-like fold domain-containing protein n=1 Tax=Apodospora peruviana TaxID=516989 RepID=A0AAE0IT34_9PEZI|nr:hypothetical protein B0H66DRAFT_542679 [Apodospora peruviana]
MALAPKFKGQRLLFFQAEPTSPTDTSDSSESLHTVELYLDYVCPFSAKMFNTLLTTVFPAIRSESSLSPKLQFLFRSQVQPWHPSSTLVHEASVAVLRLAPHKFWDFSSALFQNQKAYFDVSVVNETRNETYKRLAKLATESTDGAINETEMYDLVKVSDKPAEDGSLNVGNAVTNDLKVLIKMARLVGVHVSPTVIFDGVVAGEVSSSWSGEQWVEWLRKNVG